jgi:DNA-binding response OmpR family regulator
MPVDGLPTILAVDDEPSLTTLYEMWLTDFCDVVTATDGDEALTLTRDESIDAAVFDRHMPGTTGDEALTKLRERGHDFPVVMVTGVEPNLDIVDMPFDDYLVKPVGREEFRTTVETILARRSYDEHLREYFSLARKKAILESTCDSSTLAASAEYDGLTTDFDAARERANVARDELLEDGFGRMHSHNG